jgi:hypothetical protein
MKGIASTGAPKIHVPGWMDGWIDGWMGGWVDGWMGVWTGGCKSCFKDCLQQSKNVLNKAARFIAPKSNEKTDLGWIS